MSVQYVKVETDSDWTEERRRNAIRKRGSLCSQVNLLKYKAFAKIEGALSVAAVHLHRHQYKRAHLETVKAQACLIEAGDQLEQLLDAFDEFRDDYSYEPPLVALGQGDYARYVWGG